LINMLLLRIFLLSFKDFIDPEKEEGKAKIQQFVEIKSVDHPGLLRRVLHSKL